MSNLCRLLRDYANICLNLSNLQRAKNRGECLNFKSVERIFRLHKFCNFFEYRGRGGQRDQPASQLHLAKIPPRRPALPLLPAACLKNKQPFAPASRSQPTAPASRAQTKAARPQKNFGFRLPKLLTNYYRIPIIQPLRLRTTQKKTPHGARLGLEKGGIHD